MKKVTIELIKDNKVFRRFYITRELDKKLSEIKERYHYDDIRLIFHSKPTRSKIKKDLVGGVEKMNEEEIQQVLKKIDGEITDKGKKILKEELRRHTTLWEEAIFWINQKGIELNEYETEKVVEELIRRWDNLADEEIEEIVEEVV